MFLLAWATIFANPANAFDPLQLEQLKKTKSCPACNLSYAQIESADLAGANLIQANLQGAHLQGANLSGTILIRASE